MNATDITPTDCQPIMFAHVSKSEADRWTIVAVLIPEGAEYVTRAMELAAEIEASIIFVCDTEEEVDEIRKAVTQHLDDYCEVGRIPWQITPQVH